MLTFEQQQNLVAQGLAKVKHDFNLCTFKYSKKVMYDYLWKSNPDLLECRGHVYDNTTGQLVQAAPRKSFNYLEDFHWKDVALDTPVYYMKKYNGFMACATLYNGEIVVSTTGSTTSQFANWAREEINEIHPLTWHNEESTTLYEIIHDEDFHIVDEGLQRAVYLGSRYKDNGQYCPAFIYPSTLEEVLKLAETDKGEGFMVWKQQDINFQDCCKIKTPYYIGKKKLMRIPASKIEKMYNPRNRQEILDSLPEIWKDAVFYICADFTKDDWISTSEKDRRKYLERCV